MYLERRTFSGFKSLCMIFRECKCSNANTNSALKEERERDVIRKNGMEDSYTHTHTHTHTHTYIQLRTYRVISGDVHMKVSVLSQMLKQLTIRTQLQNIIQMIRIGKGAEK